MGRKNEEYIAGSLDDIKHVWMITKHNEKFVLSFHRESQKWDHVSGHVEKGENPLAAAKRELFEETGAIDFDIVPVLDCKVFRKDGIFNNNNRTYFVNVHAFSDLPDGSEMDKVGFFDEIPENFRYEGSREELLDDYKRIEKLASAHFI